MKPSLTAERARELLRYDPDTGVFTRLVTIGSRGLAGSIAGSVDDLGYIRIGVDGVRYRGHQLAFLMMTGEFADGDVDHIDGNRSNNKWLNLRAVSRAVNLQNRRALNPLNKSSGLLGVTWSNKAGKWWASLRVGGKTRHVGLYESKEAAQQAYLQAKRALHEGCAI